MSYRISLNQFNFSRVAIVKLSDKLNKVHTVALIAKLSSKRDNPSNTCHMTLESVPTESENIAISRSLSRREYFEI